MDKFLKFAPIVFAAIALTLASCSDDDGPDGPNGGKTPVENVFSQGLPQSVDGATFTVNEKGQVTKIVDGSDIVTFEYGTFSRANTYDVLMKLRDSEDPRWGSNIYMKLNKQGFVETALQEYLDEDYTDEWKFEYNAAGQLSRLQRTESGDFFQIFYTDGNITKVAHEDEDNDVSEYTIVYTNARYTKPVANLGNLMMFDDFFHIDMDEMGIAYFAGLLGKSTTNLPMGYSCKGVSDGNAYSYQGTYNWTFNANGLPTKFWEDDEERYGITFSWK